MACATLCLQDATFVPRADFTVAGVREMERSWRPKHNTSQTLPRFGFDYNGHYYAVTTTSPLPSDIAFDWASFHIINQNGCASNIWVRDVSLPFLSDHSPAPCVPAPNGPKSQRYQRSRSCNKAVFQTHVAYAWGFPGGKQRG